MKWCSGDPNILLELMSFLKHLLHSVTIYLINISIKSCQMKRNGKWARVCSLWLHLLVR